MRPAPKFNRGDSVKIASKSLGKIGTVVMVSRPHCEGYIIRLPNGETQFALAEELTTE